MYSQLYSAIIGIAGTYIDNQLADFEDTFAPVPPPKSDKWIVLLTDLLALGLTAVAAPFFDGGELLQMSSSEVQPHGRL